VVDRSGRRFLLLFSEAAMVLALGLLGLYFWLLAEDGGLEPRGLGWLPVTTLGLYVLAYSVGLGPVGYTIMGEILPLQVKGEREREGSSGVEGLNLVGVLLCRVGRVHPHLRQVDDVLPGDEILPGFIHPAGESGRLLAFRRPLRHRIRLHRCIRARN
jgi:hypothetical protein